MFSRPRQSLLLDLILPRSDIRDDMWVKHCLVKPHLTYDVLYVVPISSNVSHVEQPMGDPIFRNNAPCPIRETVA
jgi:hypothetical protein